jgi:hypothetical protein
MFIDVRAVCSQAQAEGNQRTQLARRTCRRAQEKVLINRVEYADGTIWQRRDWSFAAIRENYKRAIETPWGNEMCRSL